MTVRKVVVIAENTMSKSKTMLEMTAARFDTLRINDVTDAHKPQ